MIFVTVGTHEQPFDRLVRYMDELVASGEITEEVIIQTGYTDYEPKYCTWSKLLPYPEMVKNVADARLVITHGGPSSFIMPLQVGKTPIVVPRQEKYGEHVNDHQLLFALEVEKRQKNILVVQEIEDLGPTIAAYEEKVAQMSSGLQSNNAKFTEGFAALVNDLFKEK